MAYRRLGPSPLTFNSEQERLHELQSGDRLWLVSRSPYDHQYYFVALLVIGKSRLNAADEANAQFGRYCVECHREQSVDLQKRFPAEGVVRALTFSTNKPIKYGANLGQSIQRVARYRRTTKR